MAVRNFMKFLKKEVSKGQSFANKVFSLAMFAYRRVY